MVTTTHAPQSQPTRHMYAADEPVEVEVYEGDYWEPCEICFVRPTAIVLELRAPEFEALQKRGQDGDPEVVQRRYFCAEHITAADMVYRSYAAA